MVDLPTEGERQAQALHDRRQVDDPDHDPGGCWCCCLDCDFDWETVTGQAKAAAVDTKHDNV